MTFIITKQDPPSFKCRSSISLKALKMSKHCGYVLQEILYLTWFERLEKRTPLDMTNHFQIGHPLFPNLRKN